MGKSGESERGAFGHYVPMRSMGTRGMVHENGGRAAWERGECDMLTAFPGKNRANDVRSICREYSLRQKEQRLCG